jgi:hypothetical protein
VAQEVNTATLLGMDSREARKEAADRVKSEMTGYRDLIKSSGKDLGKTRVELDLARSELAKYKD